jgi:hypothetical protein
MKPGDVIAYRTPRVKRRRPVDTIMIYDSNTGNYHPWQKSSLGLVIDLHLRSNGVIILADGIVGWVSADVIEVVDEAR